MTDNPWLTTISGKQFHLLNPTLDEVCVEDIAWSLGGIRRYLNHTKKPWTVAEHSIVVAMILREVGCAVHTQLAGLFHDAAEAYIGDIPSPVKWAMQVLAPAGKNGIYELREVERRVEAAIATKFKILHHSAMPEIKQADLQARKTESRDYLPIAILEPIDVEPLPYHIEACLAYAMFIFTGECAEEDRSPADLFLDVYDALVRERRAISLPGTIYGRGK